MSKANITLRNNATRAEIHATSNDSGNFTVPNLPSGTYGMHVEAAGFQTTELSDIRVDPNIGRRIDVAMKVGDTATSVTVEANANVVQTESGAVGQLITQEQVKNIQLNSRNPIYLAQMEPGVVRSNSMAAFSFGLDNGINVNGARSQESVITFDGAPMVRTRSNGTSVGVADVELHLADPGADDQLSDGVWPHFRWSDPHGSQERNHRFPWKCLRVLPQQRPERQYLDPQ